MYPGRTPLALWLARTDSWLKRPVGAVVALPLVLPPTVIGFYLLVSMGPNGFFGQLTQSLGLGTFTFSGGSAALPVPAPAGLALLGAGLLGLGLMRRKAA